MPCPLPRRTRQVRVSVASPSARPSPKFRRVGVRDFTCEACSGFTHVTACRIARSPKETLVTRLQPSGLPRRTARQLPAQPTTRWMEPSSTGKPRRLGALNFSGLLVVFDEPGRPLGGYAPVDERKCLDVRTDFFKFFAV